MIDSGKELLIIKRLFSERVSKDSKIKSFLRMVSQNKSAGFNDVYDYSRALGKILGETLAEHSLTISAEEYKEICKELITPMLEQNHDLVMVASEEVQKAIDKADGLILGASKPKPYSGKIDAIVEAVVNESVTSEGIATTLKKGAETFTESSFDSFISSNAAFRFDAGMEPVIIRTYEGPHREHTDHRNGGNMADCAWCKNLAGEYLYSDVKNTGNDVFKRHEGCHCTVIYKNNSQKYLQNAHSKRTLNKNTKDIIG